VFIDLGDPFIAPFKGDAAAAGQTKPSGRRAIALSLSREGSAWQRSLDPAG